MSTVRKVDNMIHYFIICQAPWALEVVLLFTTIHPDSARPGNRTFPKNGKQLACEIPNIYGAVENMPRTSYVRYSAQSVHKTEYIGHRTYSTSHNTGERETNNIGQ